MTDVLRGLFAVVAIGLMLPQGICRAHAQTEAPDPALVRQGEYVARLGDCAACHTAPGGAAYAGGLKMPTPIGAIYSTNITPDRTHGIGAWSFAQFDRLMRHGVGPHGKGIYPAMPYPSYARITDADMHALYAYLKSDVAPVAQADRRSDIIWPLSMRWPLRVWAWLFTPTPDRQAIAGRSRGAYIVEGLGHCGACHTKRRLTLQEAALTVTDGGAYLAGGGVVDGWEAVNLRGDDRTGLGRWSEDDIVAFLRSGRNTHGSVFGGMTDVVARSTQYMTDADLHAVARFLKSLAPHDPTATPYRDDGKLASDLAHARVSDRAAQIYIDRCAACHRTDGRGYPGVFPPLAGNPVLNTTDATSAINIVVSGSRLPRVATAPSDLTMPPYDRILTPAEIAALATFIDTAWGNKGATAQASDVRRVMKTAVPVPR